MKKSYILKIAVLLSLLISSFYYSYAQTIPPYIPSNGLVGYWSFTGNANDESGNGFNGSVSGATLTLDRFGILNRAYSFNGTSNSIAVPNIAGTGNSARSIFVWVKTTSTSAKCIIGTGGTSVNAGEFNLVMGFGPGTTIQPGKIGLMGGNFTTGGNDFYPNNGTSVNDNQWHHVGVTYDGNSNLKIYIDGVLVNSTTITYSTTGQINFFGHYNHTGNQWVGLLDDIGIWNRALTQQEITALYLGCIPPSAASSIIGLSNVCQNQNSITYTTPLIPNATSYQWTLPSGATGTSDSNSIVVNFGSNAVSGNIKVRGVNTCRVGDSSSLAISVFPLFSIQSNTVPNIVETAKWLDYDNDGDLDYYFLKQYNVVLYINNGNNNFTEQNINISTSSDQASSAWGDYDNDGDLDFAMTFFVSGMSYSTSIYTNNGNYNFTQINLGLTGYIGSIQWCDFNNDNFLDLLISGYNSTGSSPIYGTKIFKNNGNNTFTLMSSVSNTIGGNAKSFDYNNDGKEDIIISHYFGSLPIKIYKNNGNFSFSEVTDIVFPYYNNMNYSLIDYNKDGFIDVLIFGTNYSKLYLNNHNSNFEEQNNINIPLLFTNTFNFIRDDGIISWGDYNYDGYIDFVINNDTISTILTKTKLIKNENSNFSEVINFYSSGFSGTNIWGDYDNDGDIDILSSGIYFPNPDGSNTQYKINILKNNSIISTPKTIKSTPNTPINSSSVVNHNTSQLKWNRPSDIESPQNIITYDLKIGTTNGGSQVKSAFSNNNNGYHRIPYAGIIRDTVYEIKDLPNGTYYWSVQSVDGGFKGSNWSSSNSFTICNVPYSSDSIIGLDTLCINQGSLTYTALSIPNATSYQWTLPSGITGSSTSNSINVNFSNNAQSGYIIVRGVNACGVGDSAVLFVTVKSIPDHPVSLTGSTSVCPSQSNVTYTTSPIPNATSYQWSLPSGATGTGDSNSIVVNFGSNALSGNITVRGVNSCGVGVSSILAITVNPLPTNAAAISGITTVCQGQSNVTYTVPANTNATSYIWSLPNGDIDTTVSNNISFSYSTSSLSGNITVKGSNDCGVGIASSLTITVNPLIGIADLITGSTTICPNQNNLIYSVPAITNATSYLWTLPSGATGSSTTNSITVNYSALAISGNITVKGINSCGESNISSLFINVSPLPISGLPPAIQACSIAALTANSGYTYLWSTAATTQSITVNQSGWYKCTVSNGSCSVTDSTNVTINNQYNYNCELRNDEQTSPTTYEFDIYVLNANDCVPLVYASGAYGITLNPAITNGGSISVSIVSGSSQLNVSQQPTSISYTASQNAIKILPKAAPVVGSSTIIPINSPGVKICRVKITNSQPFAASAADLIWSFTSTPYQSKINAYINNVNTLLTANATSHTTHHLINPTFIGLTPPTSITADRNNLCANDTDSIILTATGGSGNTLKWYKDSCGGVSFASGINTTIPSPDTTTTYYARWEMTNAVSTCVSVTINVTPVIMVSASISENTNHFCRGTSVTLTATLQNEGSIPLIQWFKNNQLIANENDLFYTYYAYNNDSIYCLLTSSLNGCLSSQSAKSNTIAIMVDNPPKYSHIKLYLEGFYNQSEQMMVAAMNDSTYQYGSNITDHITLMLANPYFPYTITDTFELALQTNGILIFDVPCWINGYHYLRIKSRNHLETWSMYAISFDSDSTYYDFSTSADKAAGENQKQVSSGMYAILVGDVNQDGVVDISDLVDMDSDITDGTLGYIVYDLNGDGVIDISDLVKIDENLTTGAVVFEPYVTLACANTTNASAITTSAATVGGNITCDGSALVTERGICYSTSPNPTIANIKIISGNGLGSFTANLTGLTSNTTYYAKAYATNNAGTSYGNEVSFTTSSYIYPVYDIDGNGYDTIHIGNQIWMKENLKVIHYNNGDTIQNASGGSFNLTTGAYLNYPNYLEHFGKLYNWYSVNSTNLCPSGWRVPTDNEWTVLTTYLGGDAIAGGKLKETGTINWQSNTGATNTSGFSALPGGYVTGNSITGIGYYGYWWTSSSTNSGLYIQLSYDVINVNRGEFDKSKGLSIRCINYSQTNLTIGQYYQGGFIAYIFQPGDKGYISGETHGLIVAPTDQSTGAQWGCKGYSIFGADSTSIGWGNQNTIDIMAGCSTAGIAARLCGDLVLNGYSDWYLPSLDELNKIYLNRLIIGVISNGGYWSSNEYNANPNVMGDYAMMIEFSTGYQHDYNRSYTQRVRAVRAF